MNAKRKLMLSVTGLVLLVVLAACSPKSTASAPVTSAPVTNKNLKWSNPPSMSIDTSKQYSATIKTNKGDIQVQLFAGEDPVTVNNFVFLANQGFFNGVPFHRIVKGFVIQTGDPTGTGSGGPGYKFADEKVTREYVKGTLAMANSGANTNGSQFFICLADLSRTLTKSYTIFGIVTGGDDVVQAIANTPVKTNSFGENSTPTQDVHINQVVITVK